MSSRAEYQSNTIVKENQEPRLISSVTRTGRVIYQDDFEQYTANLTEKWIQNQGTITIDTANPFRGKTCAKLVTAAVAANYAEMAKELAPSIYQRIGIEFWFYYNNALADADLLSINFGYYDGTNKNQAQLVLLFTDASGNQKWQYLNSANALTDVPSGAQTIWYGAGYPFWSHVKAVFDFNTKKYVSLICNEKVFDLSSLGMYIPANAAYPHLYLQLNIESKTATANICYIDDLIVTDQEP